VTSHLDPIDQTAGTMILSSRALIARLLKDHVRPHLWRIGAAVLCMALTAAATAAYAKILEPVLDDVFVARDATMLMAIPPILLGIALVNGLADLGQAYLMNFVGLRIVVDLQKRMAAKVIGADLAFFHRTPTGTLLTRFTADANLVRQATSSTLTAMVKDSLTLAFLVGLMFYQDWRLALVAFVAFPVAVVPVVKLGRRMRRVAGRTQGEIAGYASVLTETFQGARQVKAYNMEAHEVARSGALAERLFRLYLKQVLTRAVSTPIMELLGGCAIAAVVFYGGQRVISGASTPGMFFSFITALLLAYRPLKSLAKLNATLQEGLAATQRVFAVVDLEPDIRDPVPAAELSGCRGDIRFTEVSFSYGPDAAALDRLTLTIPAGQTIALVGPSGAGKSTILNLIPRFYDPDRGHIEIDGRDLCTVTLESLRHSIALVSQEVFLFNDTVRANIAYGSLDKDQTAIVAAARAAAADEFITALPQGYDTVIGERGVTLSGGERQRLSIARAMLKDAPILLLDEATSSLDTESERQVQAALARLKEGRTTLVIAHRLSTVQGADEIVVLDRGRVVERGSHAQLLTAGGLYARLYALQFADTEPSAAMGEAALATVPT